ncbi:hypothetical protein TrVE_jg4504 [Triparma verrucosa]|uniref:non-specific serine/threonine protein kinase n=1 Tax=Triparma verrucosa TaxID=1606542 RepID=A0A9W7FFJ7_9STRA|nr:hypothetical protein TrVE_jg4504 [Triparma verrucosa]
MEFCDGGLESIFGENDSIKLVAFRKIMLGLRSLHSHNLIHRDVKPSNIFLKDGEVRIGDLGLAVDGVEGGGEEEEDGMGTFLYRPKENTVSEKWDVYSAGVVLIEMMSNYGSGMERVVKLTAFKEGNVEEGIDERVKRLALWMTEEEPGDRPSVEEVLTELRESGLVEEGENLEEMKEELGKCRKEVERLKEILDEHGISY